jgi:DNA-binding NtrC family response regulator
MEHDTNPILMIDEDFNKAGLSAIFGTILQERLPGKRIIITNGVFSKNRSFLQDEYLGMINRTFTIEDLIACVIKIAGVKAIKEHLTPAQLERIQKTLEQDPHSRELVGRSPAMIEVRRIVKRIGPIFTCVHINGETGTGKEVVARMLRKRSGTPNPFVAVNCSTIPKSLADTHLFGHEKGAYTDAKEASPGYIARAHGGVLFLDELEDMDRSIQGKLLRLLETNEYHRVGGTTLESSRFKLITASNIPLVELKRRGILRSDLYYRLNRLVISLPPLRDRKEDIPLLVEHFLTSFGEQRRPDEKTFSRIMDHDWPGNVRELLYEMERLVLFANQEANELSFSEILTESALKH